MNNMTLEINCPQLMNTTTDWANTLDSKGQTDIIFLDISKAFDKMSNRLIISKFHYYGIRNQTLCWIGAFFLTLSKLQLLMVFSPAMLKVLECHKDLF